MSTKKRPVSLADIAREQGIREGVKFAGEEIGRQIHPDISVVRELPNGNVEMNDGSILNSSGEVIQKGSLASSMREYGGYAAAAYQLYRAMKSGSTSGKILGTAGAANTALQSGGIIGAGPGAVIGGAISATGALLSDASAKDKSIAVKRAAEDTAANFATGGLWGLGQTVDRALLGGKLDKVRSKFDKLEQSPVGIALNPIKFGMVKGLEKGLSMFGSGKGKDQVRRDAIRAMMQKQGMFGTEKDDWTLDNADGTSFDVGKDGGARLEDGRRYFDVDTEKQGAAIGSVNPLAYLMTGGDKQLATEMAGYLTNTVTQGTGATDAKIANINALDKYKKAGYDTADKAIAGIDEMLKAGRIDQATADAFKGGIGTVYGTTPAAPKPSTQTQTTPDKKTAAPAKKIERKPKADVSLADIAPIFSKPPPVIEPDDEQDPGEAERVALRRQQLEQLYKGGFR